MKDFNELLKIINRDIKENLSIKRYNHSISVMNRAEKLAIKYNVDLDKAKLVGLTHDIAREMTKDEMFKYTEEHNIDIDEIEKKSVELLHAKIGAHICKNKYGFSEDMQKAIEYHTIANKEMDDLAKIIFIADKTEDGRTFLNLKEIERKEAEGIDSILVYVLDLSIKYILEKGKQVHPDTIIARNRFLIK